METSKVLNMKAFQPLLEKGLPRGVWRQGYRISSAPPASGTKGLVALEVPQASAAEDVGPFPGASDLLGACWMCGLLGFLCICSVRTPGGCCVFTSRDIWCTYKFGKPCLQYPGANSSQQSLWPFARACHPFARACGCCSQFAL